MSEIKFADKEVILPGDILASGMDFIPGDYTFREMDQIISTVIGILNISGRIINVIPLNGRYMPRRNDLVIGKIVDMHFNGWTIDIGYAYPGNMSLKDATSDYIEKGADLSQYLNYNDLVVARVIKVYKSNQIDLTMKGPDLRRLKGGMVVNISPNKVPRLIGKQGSMISLIKQKTNTIIMVGQNGRIWIHADDENSIVLAIRAVEMVDQKAHKSGLTEAITQFLESETKTTTEQKNDIQQEI